jgi:peptidylprolyl isomerase
MPVRFLVVAVVTAAFAASCIEAISVPPCTSTVVTPVSSSADTVNTNTGLRYLEGLEGRGLAADWCQTVALRYSASLLDGTTFDSAGVDDPLVFTPGLGGLIDGVEQGVIGMRLEGTRRLIIPPSLGFGSEPRRDQNGVVVIPGNSTLIFDIEVLAVNLAARQQVP